MILSPDAAPWAGQQITSAADGTAMIGVSGGGAYGLLYDSNGYYPQAIVSYK